LPPELKRKMGRLVTGQGFRQILEGELLTGPEKAIAIVEVAEKNGVTLRLMGGLAVAFHCHLAHAEHMRGCHDIDLFGLRKESEGIQLVFRNLGYSADKEFNALNGTERLRFRDNQNRDVDVFLDKFRMEHVIDFRARLHLDNFTIPLTDLFLTKVQNVKLAAKDVSDIISLLEDHTIGDNDDQEVVNLRYIEELCADDWGLWRSVTGNLSKVSELVNQGDYEAIDKAQVLSKLESIRNAIDSREKTLRWKLRARVGEKVQWYFDVEEA